ncbi:MAG: pilus assembly protein [Alphaproteobacteria bacterium]|nr:pilus assembly protein [Alphaproteobacteria bacterium]
MAAIEFALVSSILVFLLTNVIDLGIYTASRIQVENAAQMGAQAAWQTCGVGSLPATINCPGLGAAVALAVQSTSLGTNVALKKGSPSEGYYCVDGTNSLTYVAAVSGSEPSSCASVGNSSSVPGDYVLVEVNYTYASLFPGITIASTLPSLMTKAAWMRLG